MTHSTSLRAKKYIAIQPDTTLGDLVRLLEPESVPDDRLLWNRSEAAAALGVSTRQLDKFRKQPDFPRPVILPGAGLTAYPRYRVADIKSWIDAHLEVA